MTVVPPPAYSGFFAGLGLRQRLWLAFGALAALVLLLAVAAPMAVGRIRTTAVEAISVDGQLSRLASDVATKAQAARRFDQSYFLHVDSPSRRDEQMQAWMRAADELKAAVAAFDAAALTESDRRQARLWEAALDLYDEGFRSVAAAVEAGEITTPGEADARFSTYQQNIETLGDLSVGFAARKAEEAAAGARSVDAAGSLTNIILGILGAGSVALALAVCVILPRTLTRPLAGLTDAAGRLAAGDLAARTGLAGADEFGRLGRSFDAMASTIQQRTADLEAQFAAAESARCEAEAARAKVAEQLATIEAQRVAIREMSVPLLPVSDGVLVMPLVGAMDSGRILEAQERLLKALEEQRVRHLILDITGVPVVDTQVAKGIVTIVEAARLLGAEALLVGIRPEVAQTIVGLGLDLGAIVTRSTLQSGIRYAATAATSPSRQGARP